jgi:hypothetical protein
MLRIYPTLLILVLVCSCQKSTTSGNSTTTNPGGNTAAITSVGTPTGSAVTKTIGASGGTITSADGRLELVIPSGSLSSDVSITIQPVTNQCPGAVGVAYDLLPNGTKFSTPATLKFHYTSDDVNGTDPYLFNFAFQDTSHSWDLNSEKDVDTAGKTISFNISHFTPYAPMASVRIISLDVASGLPKTDFQQGEQSTLRVVEGLTDDQWNGDDSYILLPAVTRVPDNLLSAWGVLAGTLNGSISGSGSQVNYGAPASITSDRYIYDSVVFAKNYTYKDRNGNDFKTGPHPLYITLHLHPSILSFLVEVDLHIIGASDVYNDDYHDSASFRVDVQGINVTMSNIVNQAPTETPPSGSNAGGTTATWIPDGIGVMNITGEQLGVAADTGNRKQINILFTSTGTVTPGWNIVDPVLGSYTDASESTPSYPAAITFTSSDTVQVIQPLQGTGSLAHLTFRITPIH